jgi:hypothetical protein
MLTHVFALLTLAVGQVQPVPTCCRAQLGAPVDAVPVVVQASQGPMTTWPTARRELGDFLPNQNSQPRESLPVPPTSTPKEPLPVPPTSSTNGGEKKEEKKEENKEEPWGGNFFCRFLRAYKEEFTKKDENQNGNGDEAQAPRRRALPEPWSAPPFPGHEYQGYPLIGVPPSSDVYPFMKAVYEGPWGEAIKDTRIKFYGWVTTSGNWSNNKNSNAPASYWVVPNRYELDQLVFRFEREADTVQTDHIDWGFRSTIMYGMDYRYTTAGGWGSDQLLHHNLLYGWDPIEQYIDIYVPWIMEGMVFRIGRWVACPDIETQLAPDNYLGSHSILFTYDTYTQTGFFFTFRPQEQWLLQIGLDVGDDMAPWYQGAVPCGFLGVRWVSKDNNDALYTCYNQLNGASFRHFIDWGLHQPAGHDNYNYIVSTWEHRFSKEIHTKTEGYFMWENNAELGGTPSLGPPKPFASAGSDNPTIPGMSHAYGILNYTMFALSKNDYVTVRNEWWKDQTGFRSGFPGSYTSHTLGLSHNFNAVLQVRPEIGYYRNWNNFAFDNGTRKGAWIYGFDFTLRF